MLVLLIQTHHNVRPRLCCRYFFLSLFLLCRLCFVSFLLSSITMITVIATTVLDFCRSLFSPLSNSTPNSSVLCPWPSSMETRLPALPRPPERKTKKKEKVCHSVPTVQVATASLLPVELICFYFVLLEVLNSDLCPSPWLPPS